MFPGRLRAGYVVNSNFLMKAIMAAGHVIWKSKIMNRVRNSPTVLPFAHVAPHPLPKINAAHKHELPPIVADENLMVDYGGTWQPDPQKEWVDYFTKLYAPKGPANAWK